MNIKRKGSCRHLSNAYNCLSLFIIWNYCLNSLKLKEEQLLSEVLHISSCAILSASGNDHCQNHT